MEYAIIKLSLKNKKNKMKTNTKFAMILGLSTFTAIGIIQAANLGIAGYQYIDRTYFKWEEIQAIPSATVNIVHRPAVMASGSPAITVKGGTVNAVTTAYSEIDSCHTGKSCLMASGKKAYIGAVACPRSIRLGTRVIIDNTPYVCEDRTALRLDGRYDIFMGFGQDAYNKAIQYGKRTKQITFQKG